MPQLHPAQVERKLVAHTVDNCSHDPHRYRGVLGMSRIYEREEDLVEMVLGRPAEADDALKLRFDLGDLFEIDVKQRLAAIYEDEHTHFSDESRELVADFDPRFVGHTDGEIVTPGEAVLVEIKSTIDERLQQVRENRRVPTRTFHQVQMYLAHGGYQRAFVVFVARDSGALYVHQLRPVPAVIENLNEKARRVLAEVDRRRAEITRGAA